MKIFDNRQSMIAALSKKGFTVTGFDIFHDKTSEYAGKWDYKYSPAPNKEASTPVCITMIRKYNDDD